MMSRRATPLRTTEVEAMVEKIRKSFIAGAGRLQADRLPHRLGAVKMQITLAQAREITKAVFSEIMPQSGFTVRNEQIDLADHILTAISNRGVTLAEAETVELCRWHKMGKTHGYLVPAVIAKRGRF